MSPPVDSLTRRDLLVAALLSAAALGGGAGCRSKEGAIAPDPGPSGAPQAGQPRPAGRPRAATAPARVCPDRTPRAGVTCSSPTRASCATDADCKQPHGYCGPSLAVPSNDCECRQGCATDDDCAADQRCHCVPGLPAGLCVAASCRSDADCGGRRCVESSQIAGVGCGPTNVGFHCEAPGDECAGEADCKGPAGTVSCVFENGRHACKKNNILCGRPLQGPEGPRVAGVRRGGGWG